MVPGGARRRARARPSASGSGSARAAAPTATSRRPTGSRSSAARRGRRTDEPGRHARRVVPAPVRRRAARPQLGPPRRPRRARGRSCASGSTAARPASGSTRPRCSSRTRRCPRSRTDPLPGEHPTHRPRRAPRDLPRLARASPTRTPATASLVGEVWLPDADRFARYLRPDELHTAFNFDFLARPWDAAAPARRRSTRRSRAHAPVGAPGDVGALEPRRHPAGHPLRPRGLLVRLRRASGSAPRPTSPRAAPGPGGGPARRRPARLALHLPGRRARPRRGRGPARTTASRTRCTSGRAASTRAATAAGCRCRGRGDRGRRSASARPARPARAVAAASPPHWADADRRGPGRRSGLDAQPVPCRAADPARRGRPRATARSPGCRRTRTSSPSGAATDFVCITNLSGAGDAAAAACGGPAGKRRRSRTATCRPTRPSGCARHRDEPTDAARRVPDDDAEAVRRRPPATTRSSRTLTARATHRVDGIERRARDEVHRPDARRRSWRRSPSSPPPCFAACGTAASPSPSPASTAPSSPGASAAASQGRAQEPVTIIVGALRPGVDPGGRRRADEQIERVRGQVPLDHGRARGVQLDGPDLHRGPRRRHAAGRLHDPVHRRQGPDRPAPDRRHRRAAFARSATPTSSTRTSSSTARTQTARSTPSRPRPTACR